MSTPSKTYKRIVVASTPEGKVATDNFRVDTVEVAPLKDGEFGVRTDYLLINPPSVVMLSRGGGGRPPVAPGATMWGVAVGTVAESKHPNFAVGDHVAGPMGWTEYATVGADLPLQKLKLAEGISPSAALHVLGASGVTAYFGFVELGQPKLGDTVLVSAAAGTVGSLVAQLALISGCRVIGIAGSDEKGAWLTSLGVEAVINYKRANVASELARLAPNGVDIFFDNVGGAVLEAGIANMAYRGRIILCGATSQYDGVAPFAGPANYFDLVHKEASMRGFHISHYVPRFPEARARLTPLILDGRLKYREDVSAGIETAPAALVRVMAGQNNGTQLIKVS